MSASQSAAAAASDRRLMILDLPDEIWLLVMDNLDLHHLFALSHVNRRARRLAYRDWLPTISQLWPRQRLDFWTGLAFLYQDHWVCAICNEMHPIRESNGSGPHPCLSRRQNRRFFFEKRDSFGKRTESDAHFVFHSDIQLALKRHARGIYDDDVMARVLKPHDHSCSMTINQLRTPARHDLPLKTGHHISPKIVGGRFLVYYRHTIHGPGGNGQIMRVCRHQVAVATNGAHPEPFTKPSPWRSSNTLIYQLIDAYETPNREFSGSCFRCPVDFAVSSTDGRGIDLQVWYDFGTYTSPEDVSWTVHSTNSNSRSFDEHVPVYHAPGSVRTLYDEEHGHVAPQAS